MVFADRVEIASPGHLPDSLNVEAIRQGRINRRNPTLTSHAAQILPYRGMGSGILRALREWPRIELIDDVPGNQFSTVIWRPETEWASATPQVTPQVTGDVHRLLAVMAGDMKRAEIQVLLSLKDRKHFQDTYLRPALEAGLITMTVPEKPASSQQRYRLTTEGQQLLKSMQDEPPAS